jgi:hypothetical protein
LKPFSDVRRIEKQDSGVVIDDIMTQKISQENGMENQEPMIGSKNTKDKRLSTPVMCRKRGLNSPHILESPSKTKKRISPIPASEHRSEQELPVITSKRKSNSPIKKPKPPLGIKKATKTLNLRKQSVSATISTKKTPSASPFFFSLSQKQNIRPVTDQNTVEKNLPFKVHHLCN